MFSIGDPRSVSAAHLAPNSSHSSLAHTAASLRCLCKQKQGGVRYAGGMVLLYLDFDGVLHGPDVFRHPRRGIYMVGGQRLFEHADLLTKTLEPYSSVRIVLSTSWVKVLSYSRALNRLPVALRERVVGATWHSAMDATAFAALSRGQQVLGDVGRRQPTAWLALDDDAEGWPLEAKANLLHCASPQGLADPAVIQKLREWLVEKCLLST